LRQWKEGRSVMLKLKVKKGDTVQIISGAEKGKKGEVLEVNPRALKIKVQGVRMQTHYDRKEGLQHKEGFIDYSNVKLVSAGAREKKTSKKKATKQKSA
ncbi:MAG: KOW motif-containing protein, partial [Bdellovibrionaceae bacterium]|nr:KOW motif-containing protein [Pseudobdellovibrionaceae bacterium]